MRVQSELEACVRRDHRHLTHIPHNVRAVLAPVAANDKGDLGAANATGVRDLFVQLDAGFIFPDVNVEDAHAEHLVGRCGAPHLDRQPCTLLAPDQRQRARDAAFALGVVLKK